MTTHYDNSGSEDGQLRSPGDDQFISGDDELDEHDGDSLDIKPPQASTHYSRDAAARDPKRRDKISKEKKHSKERRQHRDKSGAISSSGGGSDGGHERERERKAGGAAFREGRTEIDRYQQRGGGGGVGSGVYERNDGGRYQKHYDRNRDNHALLLHHNQQPAPIHMHRRQQDYYERTNEYHHQHGNDYHAMRQVYNSKHYSQRVDYGHDMSEPVASSMQRDRERDREKERERRKYNNSDGQQDAESLEQDLRSRLLSKRHKYVKDYEPATRKHHIEFQAAQVHEEKDRNERSYEEARKERHSKSRRGKETRSKVVIEVFDSPDITDLTYEKTTTQSQQHSKKHKRRDKDSSKLPEAPTVDINVVEKQRSPEDLEIVSRRAKLLVAEREKSKRKEQAREELEARREKRREQGAAEIIDVLSPTAVAATVTAGLSVLVKRHKSGTTEKRKKQNKKHKSKQHSDYEEGEHEEQHDEVEDGKDNEYDDSETDEQSEAESEHNVKMGKRRKNSLETLQHVKRKKLKNSKRQIDEQLTGDEDVHMAEEAANSNSDSDAASERSYKKSKAKRKHNKKSADQDKKHRSKKQAAQAKDDDDGDEVLKLPDSPLSIGELSKSPEKRHGRTKNLADDENDDDDADDDERTHSTRSHSHTRSHTESRSRSQTPHSSTHSSSHSRSRSRSRSLSHRRRRTISSSRTNSRSRSRSAHSRSSRSRSRTEERDMHANLRKSDAAEQQQHHLTDAEKRKTATSASSPTACDDKGVPLPNYFPGLQGCRSVEEFQCLNRIEEGTYGVVYRAKDKRTHEIVALKRLKMEKEKEGFPITSLREINTLLKGQHPNIVTVREIVVGSNMDKIFIVMDYVEHDLKSLMETMKTRKQCFLPGEVKCLTQQLLRAVGHLHDNWILHRDLKTSNLLLSHKGILKVGDFGLAREYGSPLKKYTSLVVTLWYRAPELLLCSPEYSTPIDIWSVGCIFAEFLQMAPLFPGKSEIDELNRIFKELGTPNDKIWPGYKDLPAVKNLLSQNSQFADYPVSNLRKRFHEKASDTGIALLHGLLTYDPKQRLTADGALKHAYFKELPLPIDPSMFPTWPAKSELGARKALASSPKPPSGGSQFKQLGRDEPISNTSTANKSNSSTGFSGIITGNKKTSANTGFVLNAGIEQRQVAMGPGFNLKF